MKDKDIYSYVVKHCPYCALCGSSNNLHIHHIIYRSELGQTSLDNLIRLCASCHTMVHSNKKVWQHRLQRILTEVIVYECHYDKKIIEQILKKYY